MNYVGASPVKRPKPQQFEEKEIIEEIIFHHPVASIGDQITPTKYLKSLIPPVDEDSPLQSQGFNH
jgi:hypothetical protein